MKHIELVTKDVLGSVSQAEIDSLQAAGKDGLAKLINGTGAGNATSAGLHCLRKHHRPFSTTSMLPQLLFAKTAKQ